MQSNSKYIFPGYKEPIEIQLFDQYGQLLKGKTNIYVRIRRHQDDYFFDWSNNTFKEPASVVKMNEVLAEVSMTYSPGIYRLDTATHVKGWDTSLITNGNDNDVYEITIVQIGGLDAVGMPVGFELHVDPLLAAIDDVSSQIDDLPSAIDTALTATHGTGSWQSAAAGNIADAVWNAMQTDHTIAGSFGDLVRRVVALQKENYFIDQMNYNIQGLMTSGRIRLFNTKAEALAATDGGTGEGEFATYSFDTTETVGAPERAKTARSVRDT